MKLGRIFVAIALACSISTFALGEDKKSTEKAADKPGCCAKAETAGKTCEHTCCVEAAKAEKPQPCEKCSKPKKEKQEKQETK